MTVASFQPLPAIHPAAVRQVAIDTIEIGDGWIQGVDQAAETRRLAADILLDLRVADEHHCDAAWARAEKAARRLMQLVRHDMAFGLVGQPSGTALAA